MPVRISFIIPARNEADRLPQLLDELRQRFPAAQLLVVDGGSDDATVRQCMRRCDQLLLSPPGRARQMNLGAQAASGDYLFFLHADSELSVTEIQLQETLAQQPAWGFSRVKLSGPGAIYRLIGWFMNQRSRLTRVATGDQMLFLHRDTYRCSGGFDDIPLMEDVAYCKRLRKRAAPLVLPWPVVTSSRRWRERGVLRTVLTMWGLRLAYSCGVSPDRLWRYYYG